MGHPKRLELILAGLLVKLANHYTSRDAQFSIRIDFLHTQLNVEIVLY